MTRDDIITLAKDYVDERGDFWPTASLIRFANQANRIVWTRLAYQDAGSIQVIGRTTYPADTESIALAGAAYLNTGVQRVIGVGTLQSDAQVSSGNRFRPLASLGRGDEGGYSDSFATSVQRHGPRWKYHNGSLYLVAPPTTATILRITYIPKLATMPGASTELLNDTADHYHDLVVSVMVTLMQAKERGAAGSEATRAATALLDAELKTALIGESAGQQLEYDSPY